MSTHVAQEAQRLVVRSEHVAISYDLQACTFDVAWKLPGAPEEETTLPACTSRVHYRGSDGELNVVAFSTLEEATWTEARETTLVTGGVGVTVTITGQARTFSWTLEFQVPDDTPEWTVSAHVEYPEGGLFQIHAISPVVFENAARVPFLGANARDWRVYHHGFQSWSPNSIFAASDKDKRGFISLVRSIEEMDNDAVNENRGKRGNFTSDWFGCVYNPAGGTALVTGFLEGTDHFGRVVTEVNRDASVLGSLHAHAFWDPGNARVATTAPLWMTLARGVNPFTSLQRYAELVGRAMDALQGEKVPVGWCSWYYYYHDVTEADMVRNLEFFKDHARDFPVDFIQLDDGYQAEIGAWTEVNEKFPRGLAWLVSQIHAAGIKAGVWIAPFFVSPEAPIYATHPDWVLRDADDKAIKLSRNWGNWQYGLDPTHPGVQEFLREVFRVITDEWGFDFVKIDFIYSACPRDAVYHDETASRAQAYRRGVELIRECLGPDRFLLGCGAPLLPCVGLVDAMRIGPDTKHTWSQLGRVGKLAKAYLPSLFPALKSTILRSFMHPHLWINDPDCLLVREKGDNCDLEDEEIRTELTIFGMSNGQVLISDEMSNLSPERLALAKKILPPLPLGEMAIPLDWMQDEIPSLFQLELERPFGHWRVLGAVNWDKKEAGRILTLDPAWGYDREQYYVIHEFWTGRTVGMLKGGERFSTAALPGHGCELYRVTPVPDVEVPCVVGFSGHFSQGGACLEAIEYDERARELTVTFAPVSPRTATLAVHVPNVLRLASDVPHDAQDIHSLHAGNIVKIPVDLPRADPLVLRFEGP